MKANEKEELCARDGGFFDIKANVAARTELGASG